MSHTVPIARSLDQLRSAIAAWRRAGETVALVPTMGALHHGHLTLVAAAKTHCTRAVVSIFVNPAQFAPHEDLARYPRDEAGDVSKLNGAGADLVWAPEVGAMYPDGFATRIVPEGAALGLEGAIRPHHFGGVATVCCKLFSQVTPDIALFGEKDYQQLCVLKQMVRDLNMPLTIAGMPTVREADGLALSSRNAYLSADERGIATAMYRAIAGLANTIAVTPGLSSQAIEQVSTAAARAIVAAGFASVDYVAVRDALTLQAYDPASPNGGRVLAAARLGTTRLIDNVAIQK